MKLLYTVFLLTFLFVSCSKPTYCECEKAALDVVSASVGVPNDVDFDVAEDCAKMTVDLLDVNVHPDKISMSLVSQVAHEICKYGYYEGKHSDDRGKKYYPEGTK